MSFLISYLISALRIQKLYKNGIKFIVTSDQIVCISMWAKKNTIFWTLCTQRIWCDGKIISQLQIETEVKSNLSFNGPMQFSKWNKNCDITCNINGAVWTKVTIINMSEIVSLASSELKLVTWQGSYLITQIHLNPFNIIKYHASIATFLVKITLF